MSKALEDALTQRLRQYVINKSAADKRLERTKARQMECRKKKKKRWPGGFDTPRDIERDMREMEARAEATEALLDMLQQGRSLDPEMVEEAIDVLGSIEGTARLARSSAEMTRSMNKLFFGSTVYTKAQVEKIGKDGLALAEEAEKLAESLRA
jgi:hypothetical protein